MKKIFFLLSLSLIFIAGCNSGPQPINFGKDLCSMCRMKIMDNKIELIAGRLGIDPYLAYTGKGDPIESIRLSHLRRGIAQDIGGAGGKLQDFGIEVNGVRLHRRRQKESAFQGFKKLGLAGLRPVNLIFGTALVEHSALSRYIKSAHFHWHYIRQGQAIDPKNDAEVRIVTHSHMVPA